MDDPSNPHPPGSEDRIESGSQAEELLADWGRRAGRFLTVAAARAREAAEDMMAEAQSIRRGERE